MKRFLLSFALLALVGFASKVNAQACTPTNFKTFVTSFVPNPTDPTNYDITFDVSFDFANNNGNKSIFINLWTAPNFANVTYSYGAGGAKAPTSCDLNGGSACSPTQTSHPSLLTIGINNDASSTDYKTYAQTYATDSKVPLYTPSNPVIIKVVNGITSFIVSGIKITVPASLFTSGASPIKGVIWSSQSKITSGNMPVQCYSSGLSFISDPTVSGSGNCSTKQYSLTISHTTATAQPLDGTYKIYADNDGNGIFNKATDVLITPSAQPWSITQTLQPNGLYSGTATYSGDVTDQNKSFDLWAEVTTTSGFVVTQLLTTAQCAPVVVLPVSFKSFSANRSQGSVSLKWETASEQNNKGFYVQRSLGNGEWKDVAFVFSQGERGNSSNVLSYSLNDLNVNKGISQYRLLQVDIDGHGKYSEVRSVRGQDEMGKLVVYPNPSNTGNVNILFEDATAAKDVMVNDLAGRTIKQYSSVSGSLEVKGLKSGFYTIKVLDRTTGSATIQKVIVNQK